MLKIQDVFPEVEQAGIYESLRTYEGVIFRAEDHIDRFFESAKTLGMKVLVTRSELKKRLEKELQDSGKKEAFIRLTMVDQEIFILVAERTHPPRIYQEGVSLKTSTVRRNLSGALFPEAKSTSGCVNQILATLDPFPKDTFEFLFLNAEGYLAEVRIGNIFMVQRPVGAQLIAPLLTPPTVGLLNGVTRRFVIECARLGKIPVEERPLMRHDLFNAEEAFLTNTSWEILPIRELDGRKIGSKLPGPVTRKLQRLFREGVRREIQKTRNDPSQKGTRQRLR
jgi:branched-chain amino acid aminotransferase